MKASHRKCSQQKKFFKLAEILEDLCNRVMELESKMMPNTSPQVLEEQKKAATKDVQKIVEAKELYAKVVKQVSQSWESLINDKELEQVTEKFHTTEEEFNKLKNDLKKLSRVEKMDKVSDMKKLHHQVSMLTQIY